jgi:hypothetical protein
MYTRCVYVTSTPSGYKGQIQEGHGAGVANFNSGAEMPIKVVRLGLHPRVAPRQSLAVP